MLINRRKHDRLSYINGPFILALVKWVTCFGKRSLSEGGHRDGLLHKSTVAESILHTTPSERASHAGESALGLKVFAHTQLSTDEFAPHHGTFRH